MSENWASRQRCTHQLIRIAARFVLHKRTVSAEQLYGLCKLTWITSDDSGSAAYINSTKKPALEDIFGRDYSNANLAAIGDDIARIVGLRTAKKLVLSDTGFTNFYKPYRNSVRPWIRKHRRSLLQFFRTAYNLKSDEDGRRLARKIAQLPGIPKQNRPRELMRAEYLLTPVVFALDSRLRFPIINGNPGVRSLLRALGALGSSLETQYVSMVSLIGKSGITDAADLDQAAGPDLADFADIQTRSATKKLLESKPTEGAQLPLKDEGDVKTVRRALTQSQKRLHNRFTNDLRTRLADFTLMEGRASHAMFDILVKNYDRASNDLLIEVKSSSEAAHTRMAIGQLFDYWFQIKGDTPPHVAVLLPASPDAKCRHLLEWLDIGALWFSNGKLTTSTARLDSLVAKSRK